ncbi:SRPBCC family protein [Actinokineospora sp. UTMC 2448]|uniref:SRPBCC family protein n=1 Tax=Actinokineospora sp. UTMC 2448 TaxID=2268449 RepID=UPI00216475FB|nr:SRPBCC family protein [Actinokineospora sp. UTMC 2448]UVS78497.1 hypothetical protein Actkin_02230 [Actinokineospora sp. UTMC 2448]
MIKNVHTRTVAEGVGALIDTLAGPDDRLWPHDHWPAMRFDRGLAVGAVGGHGPVGYTVEEHVPGRRVRFRFTAPDGFDGYHELTAEGAELRHELVMRARGLARLSWPLVFRPLHDALIEDAFDLACREMGVPHRPARWSAYVRLLRAVLRRMESRKAGHSESVPSGPPHR